MKTMLTLFAAGVLSATALSASPATAAPAQVITEVGGTVHIQQNVPCSELVDVTTSIAAGRVEITPHVAREGLFFELTRMSLFLSPFSVQRACMGVRASVDFSEVGVSLAGAVRFQAQAIPTDGPPVFRFVIPKESFLISEAVVDSAKARQPEIAYQRPAEDVVGFMDLTATEGAVVVTRVQLHVALRTQLHFQAGCLPGGRCRIDEIDEGTQTADLAAGALGTDTTPPTVACTRVDGGGNDVPPSTNGGDRAPGGRFRASASDDRGAPVIRLGTYVLGNGEVVKIAQTDKPGVHLVPTKRPGAIRQFRVGRGENFLTASDPAGNRANAYCR